MEMQTGSIRFGDAWAEMLRTALDLKRQRPPYSAPRRSMNGRELRRANGDFRGLMQRQLDARRQQQATLAAGAYGDLSKAKVEEA